MYKAIIIFLGLIFCPGLAAKAACEHDENNFRCVKYLENRDGDTFKVDIPGVHPLLGKKIPVRVAGVDTPETSEGEKCAREKANEIGKEIGRILKEAKRIDLENVRRGKYFRIVADVKFDGKSLGEYILKKGFGRRYDGKGKEEFDWCKP